MPSALAIRTDRDAAELRRLARRERDGRVSARLLALANALDGLPREEAARLAGMTGQTLGDWVHRYNAEGVEGLRDRPRPGRPCALDEGRQAALKALILKGPKLERDGCVAWRARDLPARPGRASLRGALQRDRDAEAAARARPLLAEGAAGPPRGRRAGAGAVQKNLPALIRQAADRHPEAGRVELWFMDPPVPLRGPEGGLWRGSARRAASPTSGTPGACARAGCASRASPPPTCSGRSARSGTPAWPWSCPRSRPRPWTSSWPSWRGPCRPGPTPRSCSTGPAGT